MYLPRIRILKWFPGFFDSQENFDDGERVSVDQQDPYCTPEMI